MTTLKVKIEYYLWAKHQVRTQTRENLMFLKECRSELASEFLAIMENLPPVAQVNTWSALLKRFHPQATNALGEGLTSQEQELIRDYDNLRRALLTSMAPPQFSAEHVDRSHLAACVVARLSQEFGVSFKKHAPSIFFARQTCARGILETWLDFGGRHFWLCYSHNLLRPNGPPLVQGCSLLEWLGISSQTCWGPIKNDELLTFNGSICDAIRQFAEFCEDRATRC